MNRYLSIVLLIMFIGCSAALESMKPIQVEYDKFENRTTFKTQEIQLKETFIPHFILKAYAYKNCTGDNFNCDPEYIRMSFRSQATYWKFIDYPEIPLTFIADGEIIDPGNASMVLTNTMIAGGDALTVERMGISIEKDIFMKIAFADTLEGKLGIEEFKISKKKRETWRALVNPYVMNQFLNK